MRDADVHQRRAPAALKCCPDGTVSQLRRGAAPLIGAVPPGRARRGEAVVALPAGSLLLLYTDGLVEARDRDIDEGIDVLCAVLAGLDRLATPEEICEAVLTAMAREGQADDIALLALSIDYPCPG